MLAAANNSQPIPGKGLSHAPWIICVEKAFRDNPPMQLFTADPTQLYVAEFGYVQEGTVHREHNIFATYSWFMHPRDALSLTKRVADLLGLQVPRLPTPSDPPKITFVQRSTRAPTVQNSKDIVSALWQAGYRIQNDTKFEHYDVRIQVQLMLDTDVLITPHGAGLANAAFMKPCSAVIETFGFGYVLPQYFGNMIAESGKMYTPICSTVQCSEASVIPRDVRRTCHVNETDAATDCHDILSKGRGTHNGDMYRLPPGKIVSAVEQALAARQACLRKASETTAPSSAGRR